MKKIGKKLSYMTKVLLVLGLIISNLSSLRIVFADEIEDGTNPSSEVITVDGEESATLGEGGGELFTDDMVVTKSATGLEASISEDNKITVKYGTEVNDTDELEIRITEKYENSNCEVTESILCETVINTTKSVNEKDKTLLLGDGLEFEYIPSLLNSAKFDGKYTLTVTLVNVTADNSVLDEKVIDETDKKFDVGILYKVYDSSDTLINETSGKYQIAASMEKMMVAGKMQAGGISPNDVFVYADTEYTAEAILSVPFNFEIKLSDYLYGEFKLPVTVEYTLNDEDISDTKYFTISHGTYEDNTKKLNGLVDLNKLFFEGTTKDGKLYVYLGNTEVTLDDINVPLSDAYTDAANVVYEFSTEKLGTDTVVTITDGITTITYQVVFVGDINDDGVLDENDIVALTDQLVGNDDLNLEKANIDDTDDEANSHDVLKLSQIVKTGAWGINLVEKEIQLEATLETNDGNTEFVSGDTFEINYVVVSATDDVTGFAGLVNYDKSLLKLKSLTVSDDYIGSDKDGKFIYVNLGDVSGQNENVKLLTIKFSTLKSGTATITIDNPEFFNGDTYYKLVEKDEETGETKPSTQVISLEVTISQSTDNSLSSLKLGDNEIQLEDGKYNYELTVGSDVTHLDVSALASNSAASITSTSPEELVEGENTIVVTVTSESGESQDYTIIVTKKKASEESTGTSSSTNNQSGSQYSGYSRTPNTVKPSESPKNDDKKDTDPVDDQTKGKSNLSKIIIIVLILLVIAGLIYLIFKDDDDDESKKANKDINKFKKEDFDGPLEKNTNNRRNQNQNQNSNNGNNKKNYNQNNKKGR